MIIYGLKTPRPFLKGQIRYNRPVWLMEEIGAPYELKLLDASKGEECSPEYLAINPFGRVPALQDGALKMFESGAICTYLADKHGKLIPRVGTPERAVHDQWMFTAVTMVEPHTLRLFAADFFYKDDPNAPVMRKMALESLAEVLKVVDAHLAKHRYFTGNDFAVVDIMMTTCFRSAAHTDLLKDYPNIAGYLSRTTERPAFLKAVGSQ